MEPCRWHYGRRRTEKNLFSLTCGYRVALACGSREDATPACIGDFEVTPREGGHAHDLPFLPIPIDPKRVAAEIPVRDLNFDLKRLQAAHDDGSHGTRTARSYALAQFADTLHELGFKGLRATGLRHKHVVALVREWKRQGRSIGTMNPSCPVLKLFLHQYVEG